MDIYRRMYDKSIEEPEEFWLQFAKELYWKCFPNEPFLSYNFDRTQGPIHVRYMEGAVTNVSYNVLDRIINRGQGDRVAYHWEGSVPSMKTNITYNELKRNVCKFANVLKTLNVRKGNRICIYMSNSIEAIVAMLACARIGAVHTVVFTGFSAEALADRIIDANCVLVITCDGTYRGDKYIPLKSVCDSALDICQQMGHKVMACVVKSQMNDKILDINWNENRDFCWSQLMAGVGEDCEPVWLSAEDPLFILYTSGSTGKPKGILHTTGGYLLYTYTTFKYVFYYTDGDVFFSTADLGWIVGHSFTVYGALANAATVVLFEGTPLYPDPSRLWQIVDRLSVNIMFTAPTVIRTLMRFGNNFVMQYNRESLKVLAMAGEPINAQAWHWYSEVVGDGKCLVVDNYWQTETSGPMITSIPAYTNPKPGSATFPFFGVEPAILDSSGEELEGECEGHLVYRKPWPGIARTINGRHDLYEKTYFDRFQGYYWTGDNARRDGEGYYWITGRVDDMLTVSGHLLSIVEVETAVIEHRAVSEAAAVPVTHPIKGQTVCVFLVLNNGYELSDHMIHSIKRRVRAKIGALAVPELIVSMTSLPKTESGKVIRRYWHR